MHNYRHPRPHTHLCRVKPSAGYRSTSLAHSGTNPGDRLDQIKTFSGELGPEGVRLLQLKCFVALTFGVRHSSAPHSPDVSDLRMKSSLQAIRAWATHPAHERNPLYYPGGKTPRGSPGKPAVCVTPPPTRNEIQRRCEALTTGQAYFWASLLSHLQKLSQVETLTDIDCFSSR